MPTILRQFDREATTRMREIPSRLRVPRNSNQDSTVETLSATIPLPSQALTPAIMSVIPKSLPLLISSLLLVESHLPTPLLGEDTPVPIRLATMPALSPDGSKLSFAWAGDIWIVPSRGGNARRITTHPAIDGVPLFHPMAKPWHSPAIGPEPTRFSRYPSMVECPAR